MSYRFVPHLDCREIFPVSSNNLLDEFFDYSASFGKSHFFLSDDFLVKWQHYDWAGLSMEFFQSKLLVDISRSFEIKEAYPVLVIALCGGTKVYRPGGRLLCEIPESHCMMTFLKVDRYPFSASQGKHRVLQIGFEPGVFRDTFADLPLLVQTFGGTPGNGNSFVHTPCCPMEESMMEKAKELVDYQPCHISALRNDVMDYACTLVRMHCSTVLEQDPYTRIRYQAREYIIRSIMEDREIPSIIKMANDMGLTRRALEEKCAVVTGKSPREFLKTIRLEKSLVLLQDGKSVQEVADLLLYRSVASFGESFRKRYKLNPNEVKGTARRTSLTGKRAENKHFRGMG